MTRPDFLDFNDQKIHAIAPRTHLMTWDKDWLVPLNMT